MNTFESFIEEKNGGFFNGNNNFTIERKLEYRIISVFQNIQLTQNVDHPNYYYF